MTINTNFFDKYLCKDVYKLLFDYSFSCFFLAFIFLLIYEIEIFIFTCSIIYYLNFLIFG